MASFVKVSMSPDSLGMDDSPEARSSGSDLRGPFHTCIISVNHQYQVAIARVCQRKQATSDLGKSLAMWTIQNE